MSAKDIATTYVRQLRDHLDHQLIPTFPPNVIIEVGTVGTVKDGRFSPRTTLRDLGAPLKDAPEAVPADLVYKTAGKVSMGPTVKVPGPTGGELASATLSFSKGDALVAAFSKVEARRASLKDFDIAIFDQFQRGNLTTDDVVAWSVSIAASGTVVVSTDGGTSIDVQAPIGGVIGFDTLALGVAFSNERGTSFNISSAPLYVSARLRHVTPNAKQRVGDVFGVQPEPGEVADVVVDEVLES